MKVRNSKKAKKYLRENQVYLIIIYINIKVDPYDDFYLKSNCNS